MLSPHFNSLSVQEAWCLGEASGRLLFEPCDAVRRNEPKGGGASEAATEESSFAWPPNNIDANSGVDFKMADGLPKGCLLRIRSAPNKEAKELQTVSSHQTVRVIGAEGDWAKIDLGGSGEPAFMLARMGETALLAPLR